MDIRQTPPALPPLTIMYSTVATVETFRFQGTTISQNLTPSSQQMLYSLRQLRKFNLTQELLKQFYSVIIESVLCTSITVWFSWAIRRLQKVVRTEWAKGLEKSLWTPHIQHTLSLNCCRLVEATDWTLEQPDIGTVSSLRQSILWTLDNNCGTHNIHLYTYLTHILGLHFECAHNIPVHTKLSIESVLWTCTYNC